MPSKIDKIFIRDAMRPENDGGPGSGNWGHKGRPGLRGGSGKGGAHGEGMKAREYYNLNRSHYSMSNSEAGKTDKPSFGYKGRATKLFPKGSGSFKISRADIGDGQCSVVPYLRPDGSLTPERQALHDRAIANVFTGKKDMIPKQGQKPTFYFLGGGSASGKSGLTGSKTHQFYDMVSKADVPTLDADDFKKNLPEFTTQKKTDQRAAAISHEESSSLVKRAQAAAFANGYNCVLDGTGDGSAEKVISKIKAARDAGYNVEARYVTVPLEEAIERSLDRAHKQGRYVPLGQLVSIHQSVSRIFEQIAPEFDHVALYDTNQGKDANGKPIPGKKIAECFRGGEIKWLSPEAKKSFMDKLTFDFKGDDYYIKDWERRHGEPLMKSVKPKN